MALAVDYEANTHHHTLTHTFACISHAKADFVFGFANNNRKQ